MPCYHPLNVRYSQASIVSGRSASIDFNAPVTECNMKLPCGQCVGCRQRRARDWAIRCMHEASLSPNNCFITLTYNDANLPEGNTLVYQHFQEFMKRLRKRFSGYRPSAGKTYLENDDYPEDCLSVYPYSEVYWPIRFYMAGEYGENFGRPHYHACIFNFQFNDLVFYKKTSCGEMLYRSPSLEALWPFGFSSVGTVTFSSAAYVARYINKKITGNMAIEHYQTITKDGVIVDRVPEFNKMSLKPGIGLSWFKKFTSDVFPNDFVLSKGLKLPVPKYYTKVYKCSNPFEYDDVSHSRYEASRLLLDDNTPDRLLVKKQIAIANLRKFKRSLT